MKAATEYDVEESEGPVILLPNKVTIGKGEVIKANEVCNYPDSIDIIEENVYTSSSSDTILDWTEEGLKGVRIGSCDVGFVDWDTDESVLTKNGDEKIEVIVKKAPTSIKMGVSKITLKVGKSVAKPKTTLSTGSACRKKTWSLLNPKGKTLIEWKNGKIYGKAAGTAKLRVTTYNGKKATINVIVKKK